MHPLLLKYGLPLIGVAVVGLALWAYGKSRFTEGKLLGKAEIQALWDEDRKVWQEEFDAQVKAKEKAETEAAAVLKEKEDEWKVEKEGLVAGARGTARLLRDYKARASLCAVSGDAGTAAGTGSAGEEPGVAEEIERVTEEHFGNCASDASQLTRVQEKWEEVREALRVR